MKLSILALTIDRFDISSEIIPDTALKSGIPGRELLIADNGSTDKRIIEEMAKQPELTYHRLNSTNEGVGRAFNQLMLRAKGEYIALIGNDILMQNNWAKEAIEYWEKIKMPGIAAIHCVQELPPLNEEGVHASDKVFGTWIFHRSLLQTIGYFHEGYFPYGLEDTDFNLRSHFKGLTNFYVPNQKAIHVGHDVDEKSDYRAMKNKSLEDNYQLLLARTEKIVSGEIYYEMPPVLRDPL